MNFNNLKQVKQAKKEIKQILGTVTDRKVKYLIIKWNENTLIVRGIADCSYKVSTSGFVKVDLMVDITEEL